MLCSSEQLRAASDRELASAQLLEIDSARWARLSAARRASLLAGRRARDVMQPVTDRQWAEAEERPVALPEAESDEDEPTSAAAPRGLEAA